MEKKKCGQCGLVNWPGVMECARCGAFISEKQQAAGRNPYEIGSEPRGFNPLKLVAVFAVVMVCGIGAYIAFSASTPPKPAASPETGQAVASPDQQQTMSDPLVQAKQEGQRLAEQLGQKQAEEMRKHSELYANPWNKSTMTPEQLANQRRSACAQGVKNMGPC